MEHTTRTNKNSGATGRPDFFENASVGFDGKETTENEEGNSSVPGSHIFLHI
ncbi:TPA: hypothetical protein MB314_005720 [Klebsiella pneumoniae]|nr:hypothetical protein [Klebsiella pneumoniae]